MTESVECTTAPRGRLSIRTVAMPANTNMYGQIFGGWVLSQMDLAGGTHAYRRAKGRCATVAIEGMEFHQPVFVGDELSCYTEILRVGTTSVAIRVECWVRRHEGDETQIKVTSAIFTFVAVDDQGHKRRVPPENA